MKTIVKNFTLVLLIFSLISCISYEKYESGNIKSKGKKVFNKKIGNWIYYYDMGGQVLFKTGKYTFDKECGNWSIYHINQNLKQKGKYRKGEQTGIWHFYHFNGILHGIGKLNDGKRDSIWTWYHSNGKLHTKRLWDNGNLIKVYICLDSLGNELNKGTIENRNGTLNIYESDGKLIDVIKYEKGKIIE